jgi:hypothetical protein
MDRSLIHRASPQPVIIADGLCAKVRIVIRDHGTGKHIAPRGSPVLQKRGGPAWKAPRNQRGARFF